MKYFQKLLPTFLTDTLSTFHQKQNYNQIYYKNKSKMPSPKKAKTLQTFV